MGVPASWLPFHLEELVVVPPLQVVPPPRRRPRRRKRRRRSPTRIWVSVFSTKRTKYFFTDDTRLSILHDKWSGLLGGVVRALQGICMSWEMGRIDGLL